MSLQSVAHQFVEMCRQGKNFDVMRSMYAPNIVSVEGDGKQTAGQAQVIKKSEDWGSDKTFHGETVAGPFYTARIRTSSRSTSRSTSRPRRAASAPGWKKSGSTPSARRTRSRASSSSTRARVRRAVQM